MSTVEKLLRTSEAEDFRLRRRGKGRAEDRRPLTRPPVRRLGRFAKRLGRHQARMADEQPDYSDHSEEPFSSHDGYENELPDDQARVAQDDPNLHPHGDEDEEIPDEESELDEQETQDPELVAAFIKAQGKKKSWQQSRDKLNTMKRE